MDLKITPSGQTIVKPTALGPVANTDTKLLIYGLFQKGRVLAQDERHLKRILRKYVDYYHSCRTHLSLEKDAPEPRRVESPAMGKVRAIPKVGGLHHYYTRHAAA